MRPASPSPNSAELDTPLEWLIPDEDRSLVDEEDNSGHPTSVHHIPLSVVDTARPLTTNEFFSHEVAFRFRRPGHAMAHARTLASLRSRQRHAKRAIRLAGCGSHATVWHSPTTDTIAIRAYHCGLRCCPRCRETHSAKTRDTIDRFLAKVDRTRLSMLTLTLVHTDQPLADQIDHLYRSFRRLRASKLWRTHNPKGFAVCEVSRSADGLAWHPHLHLLAEMPYIEHALLTAAWLAATVDSSIVHIRRINRKSVEKHRDYLTSYLTKPPTQSVLDSPELLLDWIDAFTSRHVLLRFGKPELAESAPPPEDPQDWLLIGRFALLVDAMLAGDGLATHWMIRIGKECVKERRDSRAGKDYGADMAYRTPDTPQYL